MLFVYEHYLLKPERYAALCYYCYSPLVRFHERNQAQSCFKAKCNDHQLTFSDMTEALAGRSADF